MTTQDRLDCWRAAVSVGLTVRFPSEDTVTLFQPGWDLGDDYVCRATLEPLATCHTLDEVLAALPPAEQYSDGLYSP